MKNVFIIAEAGVNHNGSLTLAKEMVQAAAEAGADAVKFQTFSAEKLVSRNSPKAEYQRLTTDTAESHFEMIKKLELNIEAHRALLAHCRQQRIMFLSSPFDLDSIRLLDSLGMTIFKIPSGEITNLPYLRQIGKLGKDVILSSGMANLREIGEALAVLVSSGTPKEKITVLHCNTEYPTPMRDVNLKVMNSIKEKIGVRVGYSDHTQGIEVSVAAAALGAEVIEKHFTLDRTLSGPDHRASLEPGELKTMVKAIRNIEKALGNGIKKITGSEKKNKVIARKSIVAARVIDKDELLTEDNITTKRPGTGLSPMKWDEVIGARATRDYQLDEEIVLS